MGKLPAKSVMSTVSLLRFGSYPPASVSHYWHSYATIATLTGLTHHQVSTLCHHLVQSRELGREVESRAAGNWEQGKEVRRGRPSKLLAEHRGWLLSERTLEEEAGLSLKARCVVFGRRFPGTSLSATGLRQLYHQHGVHWKDMRLVYRHSEAKLVEIRTKR